MAGQQRERAHHGLDDGWMDRAACSNEVVLALHGAKRSDFFRDIEVSADAKFAVLRAKKVCGDCTERERCLLYAVDGHLKDGVWGGMNPRERRRWAVVRNKGTRRRNHVGV